MNNNTVIQLDQYDNTQEQYLIEYKKICDTYRSLAILALEQDDSLKAKKMLLKCDKQLEILHKEYY